MPTLKAADEQVGGLPDQINVNLDRGYDSDKSRCPLRELGFTGEIARKGVPAPIQAGRRWVVERSQCATRRSVCIPGLSGRNSEGGSWVNDLPGAER